MIVSQQTVLILAPELPHRAAQCLHHLAPPSCQRLPSIKPVTGDQVMVNVKNFDMQESAKTHGQKFKATDRWSCKFYGRGRSPKDNIPGTGWKFATVSGMVMNVRGNEITIRWDKCTVMSKAELGSTKDFGSTVLVMIDRCSGHELRAYIASVAETQPESETIPSDDSEMDIAPDTVTTNSCVSNQEGTGGQADRSSSTLAFNGSTTAVRLLYIFGMFAYANVKHSLTPQHWALSQLRDRGHTVSAVNTKFGIPL